MDSPSVKFLLILFLIYFFQSDITAQQYPITHYTRDRGLTGNQVWEIFQDSKGYMWFATSSGLIKYNGREYKFYGKREGLQDEYPLGVTEDTKGNIWAAFEKGVSRIGTNGVKNWKLNESGSYFGVYKDSYNRLWCYSTMFPTDIFYYTEDSLHNFSEEHGFKNQVILNITEDYNGGVYFILRKGKIIKYLAGKLTEINISDLSVTEVRYIFFDSFNNCIICTAKGLGIIPIKDLENNPPVKWILGFPMKYGFESKSGLYWFASEKGIFRINSVRDYNQSQTIHITEENGLLSDNIYRLYEDFEGNIWIGRSEKGISKISSLMFSNYGRAEGLTPDAILSVSKLDGSIVLCTDKGLYKFSNNGFTNVIPSGKYSSYWFTFLHPESGGEALLGSTPGIFHLSPNSSIQLTGLHNKFVRTIMKDHEDKIWVGTNEGLYLKNGDLYLEKDFVPNTSTVIKLAEVGGKDLYVGTDKGLILIENGTLSFAKTKIIYPKDKALKTEMISDIVIDKEGYIISAVDKGLRIINNRNEVTDVKELDAVGIITLLIDRNNRLWGGTVANGLYLLQKRNNKYEVTAHYTHREGMASDEFTFNNTIYEDTDGKIYFGMFGGMTVYNPLEERSVNIKPRTYISAVVVNDSLYSVKDITGMDLSHSENRLSFNCEGLSFYNEEWVKFEYYLAGIEKEWSNSSFNSKITYGYLEPGEYTFFVRAVNQFGISGDPQSVSFVILAPFYKRPWFIILSIILLVYSGYRVNNYRQISIKKRNLQLEQLVKEKTQDLEESKLQIEKQYQDLVQAQKELVEKRELERAHNEIKLLKDRLAKENIYLREKHGNIQEVSSIIGRSAAIHEVRKKVVEIAGTDSTVLITGETGVGKNLVAEAIHGLSTRKDRALVTVNCAAIPDALVESELFGHEKGAFTGADTSRIGKFEVADGSTIFLDEIGDMNLAVQAKLLNVIQSRKLVRVGGNQEINLDVRIIAATNHDLAEAVKKGKFRQDLYYRINVYTIHIHPLRECPEDIEPIAKYFIDRFSKILNKRITAITKSALNILQNYSYPGNIRELENIIHRSIIISKNEVITDEDILVHTPSFKKAESNFEGEILKLEEMEKEYIAHVLSKTKGKISGKDGAADLLGINPSTLRSRMKKLGIPFQENYS